jgi:hypothetical protein
MDDVDSFELHLESLDQSAQLREMSWKCRQIPSI